MEGKGGDAKIFQSLQRHLAVASRVTAYLKVQRSGGRLREEGRGEEVDIGKLRQPVVNAKWGYLSLAGS